MSHSLSPGSAPSLSWWPLLGLGQHLVLTSSKTLVHYGCDGQPHTTLGTCSPFCSPRGKDGIPTSSQCLTASSCSRVSFCPVALGGSRPSCFQESTVTRQPSTGTLPAQVAIDHTANHRGTNRHFLTVLGARNLR